MVRTQVAAARAAIVDLDGTTYIDNELLPGAAAGIALLRKSLVKCLFVTNNSIHPPCYYSCKLTSLGIEASDGDIITPLTIASGMFARSEGSRLLFFGEKAATEYLAANNVEITTSPYNATDVLIGLDRSFTLGSAVLIRDALLSGARYYATNPDTVWPTRCGGIPDTGVIIAAITAYLNKQPTLIGKPSRFMVEAAMLRSGCQQAALVVIGDRMSTDMKMAATSGIPGFVIGDESSTNITTGGVTVVSSLLAAAESILSLIHI